MKKLFYAVQVGSYCELDIGSTVKRKAIKIANDYKRCHAYDGQEIRIIVVEDGDDFALDEIIIREGNRI